jgi:hypothetical protein
MLGREAGKLLDATDYVATQASRRAMSLGAWAVPFCYRKECHRLINARQNEADILKDEEDTLRGIAGMTFQALRGQIPVRIEVIQTIAHAIGPTLHEDSTYSKALGDPHKAEVLNRIAPLHDENR